MSEARPLLSFLLLFIVAAVPLSATFPSANPSYQSGFPVTLNGTNVTNPALGDLTGDGIPEIVVGGNDGKVHAYTGTGTKLWEYDTGGMGISGKAAIADIDSDGFGEVVIGAGHPVHGNNVSHGGLYVISHTGALQCQYLTDDDPDGNTFREAVYASPAVGELDNNDDEGLLEIAFGSWDRHMRVINHDCTDVWEVFLIDEVWSSPAIGDIDGNGQLDVIVGVNSDNQFPDTSRIEGGELYVFNGATGAVFAGFPTEVDEMIWSSPALADLDDDGWLDIVVGTGYCWVSAACAPQEGGQQDPMPGAGDEIHAWDRNGNPLPGWPFSLPNISAFASPAIADIDNDGEPEVIINTDDPENPEDGKLYVINGDGSEVWSTRPVLPATPTTSISFSTTASPIAADITGDGNLEIVLPSNWDLVVYDKDGNQLSRDSFPTVSGDFELTTSFPVGGAGAVGDIDGDGDLEVVGAGFSDNQSSGAIYVWDFPAADDSRQEWPVWRHSSANIGNAGGGSPIFADGFESGDTSAW